MLRPAQAARRFGVSEKTLARWAAAGLIGRSQIEDGGAVWYVAGDIAELRDSKLVPRRIVPIVPADAPAPEPSAAWENDPFWAKSIARAQGSAAR